MQFPQFCGPSYVDQFPNAECEDAINLYLEQVQSGNSKNSSGYVMKRSPGLDSVYSLGSYADVPGMFSLNSHIFAAIGNYIYDFTFNGTSLSVGVTYGPIAVDGKPVEFVADPAGTQLGVYSAGHVYCIESGALTEVTWPGVLLAGIALVNQYFLLLSAEGDGFFYSEPGDLQTGSPLNFRTAESNANKYISILIDHEQVWLHGNGAVTQVFYSDRNDPSEPFKPNPSAVIPQGSGAAASAVSFNNRVWWISPQGIAYRSNGYLPEQVSTHAVENQWRTYGTISDAIAWTLTWNGHQCIRFYFPTAGMTWELDTELPIGLGWRKVLGWDETLGLWTAHRGMSSCEAYGKTFIGDRAMGKIYTLNPDSGWDDDVRIHWDRIAPVINQDGHLIENDWFEVSMQMGGGDGGNLDPALGEVTPESDPQVLISYAKSIGPNGPLFSSELQRSMGRAGEYNKRITVPRGSGISRQLIWRVRGSAAVPTVINTVYLDNPEALAS